MGQKFYMEKQLITEMYLTEADIRIPQAEVIIIPLGAESKEHGPHLPMNTDYLMANCLRDRILEKMPNAIAAATIGTNYFPAFTEYPGSISLELTTAKDLIVQTCQSLSKQGAKSFYILNTGISTIRALAPAKSELAADNIYIGFLNLADFERESKIKDELRISEFGTHAGDVETSIMLYLKPEVVQMEKAIDNDCPNKPGGLTRNIHAENRIISVNGVWGKPSEATKEKGEVIVTKLIAYIENDIRFFIKEYLETHIHQK